MMYTTKTKDYENPDKTHEVYIWKTNPFGKDFLVAKKWMNGDGTRIFQDYSLWNLKSS